MSDIKYHRRFAQYSTIKIRIGSS